MTSAVLKHGLPPLRILLLGIWVAMVIAVIVVLIHEDRFFAVAGKPVAYLKSSTQEVTFRTEDDIKWKSVEKKQGFFDGDRIATGTLSAARVDFGEGRSVEIDQDSIIAISSIRESSGNSFIINLIKGGIKPNVPSEAKHALVVMSGTSTFVVEPGEERGFAKPTGGILREFNGKEKFPVRIAQKQPETEKFVLPTTFVAPRISELPAEDLDGGNTSVALAPVVSIAPTPSPVATTKPIAKTVPSADVSTTIVENSVAPTYFTIGTMGAAVTQAINVAVKSTGLPAGAKAFVALTSNEFKMNSFAQNGVAQLMITNELLQKGLREEVGPLSCIALELQAGTKFSADSSPTQNQVNEKKIKTKICSLMEAKGKLPLTVGLMSMPTPSSNTNVFPASTHSTKFPIEITVTRAADYIKLLPYIRGASSFAIRSVKKMEDSGVFFVESGKITAQIDGGEVKPEVADKVMQILGSTFVFKGNRSAIYDASGLDVHGFKNWIGQNTAKGRNVYIRAKASLVPVSRDFMEERQEVADFVKKSSGTIFLEKVEIIAYQ